MRLTLTDFSGATVLTRLNAKNVIRDQTDGGADILTFTIPVEESWGDFGEIQKGHRILIQTATLDWQEFIISTITEAWAGVEITAEHAIYELLGDYIEDKRPTGAPDYLMDTALAGTGWTRTKQSGIATEYSTSFYRISAREALAKIQETTGLVLRYEVKITGSTVTARNIWWEQPGSVYRGYRFTGRKNADKVTRKISNDRVITSLYGYGRGEYHEETGGYGRRVDFAAINGGLAYVSSPDAVAKYGRHIFGKVEFDDTDDPAEVLVRTQEELAIRSQPKVSYSGSVEQLGFDNTVGVGESVLLIDDTLNIRVQGRVLRITYYLDKTEPNKIEVGNYNDIFAAVKDKRTLNDIRQQLAEDPTKGALQSVVAKAVTDLLDNFNDAINSGMLDGHTTVLPGGFLFESSDDSYATHIGPQGWRVANTKNPDGTWKFITLATGDGLAAGVVGADQIVAGAITGDHIKAGSLTADKISVGEEGSEETLAEWVAAQLLFNAENLEQVQTMRVESEQAAKTYTDLQLEADRIQSEAYADGVYTLAEQKAIAEASQAAAEAKAYADEKEAELSSFLQGYVTGELSDIKRFLRTDELGRLLIGKAGDPTVFRLDNDRISFLADGMEVAYFADNKLYVLSGLFFEIWLGNLAIKEEPSGDIVGKFVD